MNRVLTFAAGVLATGVAAASLAFAPSASAATAHPNPANCVVSFDELPDHGPCIWLGPELGDGRADPADGPYPSFGLDEAGVFHKIPNRPCRYEDGSLPGGGFESCYWHASQRGNGVGDSYWIDTQGRAHDLVSGRLI